MASFCDDGALDFSLKKSPSKEVGSPAKRSRCVSGDSHCSTSSLQQPSSTSLSPAAGMAFQDQRTTAASLSLAQPPSLLYGNAPPQIVQLAAPPNLFGSPFGALQSLLGAPLSDGGSVFFPSSASPRPSPLLARHASRTPPKKPAHPVPEEKKDEAYWTRRRKNNDAAKRSRDLRRVKEEEIGLRATFLEQENLKLRAQVALLKNETAKLHFLLFTNTQRKAVASAGTLLANSPTQ